MNFKNCGSDKTLENSITLNLKIIWNVNNSFHECPVATKSPHNTMAFENLRIRSINPGKHALPEQNPDLLNCAKQKLSIQTLWKQAAADKDEKPN